MKKKTVQRSNTTNPKSKHLSDLSSKNRKTRIKALSDAPSSKPHSHSPKSKLVESNLVEKDEKLTDGIRRKVRADVSARQLGASLWRMQLPESGGGTMGCHQFDPSSKWPNSAMEGATKWDPVSWQAVDESKQTLHQSKILEKRENTAPVISAIQTELEQARTRINELESERKSSKKKLEQFLQKLSEEKSAWRCREHEKIRAIIDDMKADLNREKKNRQRLEMMNSKLVNELTELKLSAKRYMHEYGKERKARELIEEVCDELAKEIGEDKAEAEALKRESMELQEEVEEERKMLQMAEVWREERVQMKLIDAKVMLEEKFSQMNEIVAEIKHFLNSSNKISNLEQIKKAEIFKQMAASVSIQDVRDLKYEPPSSEDIFSIFENMNSGESNEKEIEPCSEDSPEVKMPNKNSAVRHSDLYEDQSEDTSEWETASRVDDQRSSFSPEGSDGSMNKKIQVSSVSRSGTEWERSGGEETPVMEIKEVGSNKKTRQLKKVSSISRLWKSRNGDNYKVVSVEGMNGIEQAGGVQDSTLKSRLLEARMEKQKIQLRQVLKQKI